MSPAAPEPDPHPNVHGFAEVSELGQFKQFIYDNYHETHGIFGNEAESAWERRFRGHVPVMRQLLPANKTGPVLDFGCGDGLLLAVAQSLGYDDLTGVDISGALLKKAAQRTSAKLHHADGLELLKASPNGTFEAIIAFDILEHLTRPELLETSREISRTLKPGGRLIVRVPNGGSAIAAQSIGRTLRTKDSSQGGRLSNCLNRLASNISKLWRLRRWVYMGLKVGFKPRFGTFSAP